MWPSMMSRAEGGKKKERASTIKDKIDSSILGTPWGYSKSPVWVKIEVELNRMGIKVTHTYIYYVIYVYGETHTWEWKGAVNAWIKWSGVGMGGTKT